MASVTGPTHGSPGLAELLLATHFIFFLPAGLPAPPGAQTHANRETAMAATRKSAKRSAAKKRATAKRSSSKKQPARKSTSKRGSKKSARKTTSLKGRARKGLKAARSGLGSVLKAGKKTWEKVKPTTADVIG
jgi:hypothetical protein